MACARNVGENEFQGGYELKTVDENKDLICSICLQLLRNAMGTPCSHAFCRACIQNLLSNGGIEQETFKCPECRQIVGKHEIAPIPFVDRLVRGSNVYCSQKTEGCEWIGTLSSYLEQHKTVCNFQTAKCPNEGCVYTGVKRKIKDHESECKHRILQCKYCQTPMKANEFNEHKSSCERRPTPCPRQSCTKVVPKAEIQKHLDQDCLFEFVSCTYANFGCSIQLFRKNMDKHVEGAIKQHMALMCNHLSQYQTQNRDLKRANEEVKEEIRQLKLANDEIPKLRQENSNLKAAIQGLRNQVTELNGKVNNLTSMCPEFRLKDLFLKGVKKWKKKDESILIEETYAQWYKKIFDMMSENKLYRLHKLMFVKVRNPKRKPIFWSSNGKEEQDKAAKYDDVCYTGDDRFILREAVDQLVLETETLNDFTWHNSDFNLLHPTNERVYTICGWEEKSSYTYWCCNDLSKGYYVKNQVILCVVKYGKIIDSDSDDSDSDSD